VPIFRSYAANEFPPFPKEDQGGLKQIFGEPCPELGRRVASLYQDKEDSMKVNTNEGEGHKEFCPRIT
jgi:hypothetical protein